MNSMNMMNMNGMSQMDITQWLMQVNASNPNMMFANFPMGMMGMNTNMANNPAMAGFPYRSQQQQAPNLFN